jgi:hypothetical protein
MFFPWLIGRGFDAIGPSALPLVIVCAVAAALVVAVVISRRLPSDDIPDSPGGINTQGFGI